jgi:hypothetical protein
LERERALVRLAPGARRAALQRAVFGSERVWMPALLSSLFAAWSPGGRGAAGELLEVVQAAYQALPRAWVSAVVAGLPPVTQPQRHLGLNQRLDVGAVQGAVGVLARRLGWGRVSLGPCEKGSALLTMSVKAATLKQLGPRTAAQRGARGEYVEDALAAGAPAPVLAAAVSTGRQQLEIALGELWRVEWDNRRREILWRLTVNGVPGAGGHGIAMRGPCKCGWAGPPAGLAAGPAARQWRLHHFWSCPVATAVVDELQSALPAGATRLTCASVWLAQAPPGVHSGVWGIVCAAAVEAMERGRRALWAASVAADPAADLQLRIAHFFQPAGALAAGAGPGPVTAAAARAAAVQRRVSRAQRRAAAWVWCILHDFVFVHGAGESALGQAWSGLLNDEHPFVGVGAGERLVLRLPPGLVLPADI